MKFLKKLFMIKYLQKVNTIDASEFVLKTKYDIDKN